MNPHHRDIGRQRALAEFLQPLYLATRAIEALYPVSATQRDQQVFGARITKHRHIGGQGFA
ncbi:hypothetical protein D3C80_2172310 [compost metagenome]